MVAGEASDRVWEASDRVWEASDAVWEASEGVWARGGGRTYAWMENVAQKEMESVWLCLAVFYGIFSYIDSHFLV